MCRELIFRRSKQRRKRALGGLIACFSMVTTIAALSSSIAPKVGISQRTLLGGDIAVAGMLFALCLWMSRV